jgi:hypothetical protein
LERGALLRQCGEDLTCRVSDSGGVPGGLQPVVIPVGPASEMSVHVLDVRARGDRTAGGLEHDKKLASSKTACLSVLRKWFEIRDLR